MIKENILTCYLNNEVDHRLAMNDLISFLKFDRSIEKVSVLGKQRERIQQRESLDYPLDSLENNN